MTRTGKGLTVAKRIVIVTGVGLGALIALAAQGQGGSELQTIDPTAQVGRDGQAATVTGPITCTSGERVTLEARVNQRTVPAWGEGQTHLTCTGAQQQWSVQAVTRDGTRFSPDHDALAVAFAVTRAGGRVTDAHQWSRQVDLTSQAGSPAAGCLDPLPDPLQLGWQTEGTEQYTSGLPLKIFDSRSVADADSPQPWRLFYCDATSLSEAGGEIVLTPSFQVFSVTPDGNGNTGVYVAIGDGVAEIRVVLFQPGSASELRLQTTGGFSHGVPYFGGRFTLRRLADGSGSLEVPGQPPLTIGVSNLVQSHRSVPTIEFGTYATGSTATLEVTTLGLPAAADS